MTTDDGIAAVRLLKTGTLVPFRIVEERVVAGSDTGGFSVRIELLMDDADEAEADDVVSEDGGCVGKASRRKREHSDA